MEGKVAVFFGRTRRNHSDHARVLFQELVQFIDGAIEGVVLQRMGHIAEVGDEFPRAGVIAQKKARGPAKRN
jgi:hypothetical protein